MPSARSPAAISSAARRGCAPFRRELDIECGGPLPAIYHGGTRKPWTATIFPARFAGNIVTVRNRTRFGRRGDARRSVLPLHADHRAGRLADDGVDRKSVV